ncbi:MAG TPA: PH domain-containing protein [Segetibacter sp.]|jgi:putative membrane protein
MENLTDNYEGWHVPQRQSPAAIFILILKSAIDLLKGIWPFVLIYIFRKKKEGAVLVFISMLICFTLLATITAFVRYWFYKFHIDDDKLVIQSGWLKKKTLTVPLKNILAVHLEQSIWQRVLQVVKVSIDSAGSEKTEVKIDALSVKKAEQLKAFLLSDVRSTQAQQTEEKIERNMQTRLSAGDLLKFSLTSNHLETFLIIISLSLNLLDDIKDAFNIDSWGIMESYAMKMASQTAMAVSILVIAVALLSIVFSIIRTVLKFFNYTIEEMPQGWKVSFGLTNHQQRIIPSNKIQILSWKANWLRRKINFWIVTVQSIGANKMKPKEQIQIPITSLSRVFSLVPIYQNSEVFEVSEGARIEPDYWKRRTLTKGVIVTALIASILYFAVGIAALWTLILLLYFAWYFRKWYVVFRWQINAEGLQMYSGVWGRKYTLLTWKKVQQIQVDQSPYQRSHELANVTFRTAGGQVKLPFIKLSTATYLADLSLYYVESRDENWM